MTLAVRSLMVPAVLAGLLADPALPPSQRVAVRTEDGVTIAATWYETGARSSPAVVLVHMLHRSRRDWEGLAARLASDGIGALAIDLRGHGDSGGAADGDETFGAMVQDIAAARRYLAGRGDVQASRIGIIGASLGANLAVLEASVDSGVASLALLSPSLDYRGLRIEAAFRKYGSRPALLVSSDDDPYATRTVRELKKGAGGSRESLLLPHAGHGTVMLGRDVDISRALVEWFKRTL